MSKIVLGGGLSGLSAAYYLKQKFPNQAITLIEASQRTGGWIKSDVQSDGTVFEQGPRTIRPRGESGANTLKLVEDLGLHEKIIPITSNDPAAKNRMIYANGSLHLLPSSLMGLFKKQKPFSKPLILHLMNDLTAKRKRMYDEPIYNFIERRFGEEVADYLISPLICGICAGNAQEISVKFLMKQLFEYEQEYGSISLGLLRNLNIKYKKSKPSGLVARVKSEKWSIYSFTNGCETLPIALKDNLLENNVNLQLNSVCKKVIIEKKGVVITLNNDEKLSCDHLVCAIPSSNLAELVQGQHPQLANVLKPLVKNVSVGVVNLSYTRNVIKEPAFGLLVAPKERIPILGIIFDSCCFPKKDAGTVLTVMMGGHWFEKYFGENPSESLLLNVAQTQIKEILNIDEDPSMSKVNILHNCLPQYVVGHSLNLSNIENYIRLHRLPISLCGSSYYGVGINDVILSAKEAVFHLLK